VNAFVRGLIVAVVLLFVWRGKLDSLVHPRDVPAVTTLPSTVVVDDTARAWVKDVKVDAILPADRNYYGRFFDALTWILGNDGDHDAPNMDTNEKLRRFYSGSLDLAIEKKAVGKYPGLSESLDKAFALAASGIDPATLKTPEDVAKAVSEGLAPRPMTKALRDRMMKCSAALHQKLRINGE